VQEGDLLHVVSVDAGESAQYLADLLAAQSELLSSLALRIEWQLRGGLVSVLYDRDRELRLKRITRWEPRDGVPALSEGPTAAGALEGEGKSLVRLCICAALARVVRERVAVDYMASLLECIGPSLEPEERATILDEAVRQAYAGEIREEYALSPDSPDEPNLWACLSCTDLGLISSTIRVDYVFLRLYEHLSTSDEISLEGFIRFRLRDYLARLRTAVYRAIDGFLMDQQQREFVDLLRYFVEVQKPRIESVTVVRRHDGRLQFFDATGQIIDTEGLLEGYDGLADGDFGAEDILIGLLIAIAPARVLICMRGGQLLFETTLRVFSDRVLVCDGCSSCCLYECGLSD
jgi:hypothetical protein